MTPPTIAQLVEEALPCDINSDQACYVMASTGECSNGCSGCGQPCECKCHYRPRILALVERVRRETVEECADEVDSDWSPDSARLAKKVRALTAREGE